MYDDGVLSSGEQKGIEQSPNALHWVDDQIVNLQPYKDLAKVLTGLPHWVMQPESDECHQAEI